MKKLFSVALLCSMSFLASAQFKQVVVEEIDNGGKVPGRTYRIYAELEKEKDQVYVIFGDSLHKLEIKSTKPFFQSNRGGASAKDANRKLSAENDSLRYDSWVTIGATDNYDNNLQLLNVSFDDFEKKGGAIRIPKDGAWFCVPTDKQGTSGANKKILLFQLTTAGQVDGQFSLMGKTVAGESYVNHDIKFSCGQKSGK